MSHQVFIERCRDGKPETAASLAAAIAKRYGISPDQILSRLQKGRFQVKANLDISAAREFMTYLEAQGALCSIVDQAGEIVTRSSQLAATVRGRPAQGLPDKDPASSDQISLAKTLPPTANFATPAPTETAPKLALMTPPPPPDSPGGEDYESGLAAAYAGDSSQDLGALNDGSAASSGSLRLETLDGASEEEEESKPNASVAEVTDVAAFMPPDMLEEQKLELDVDPPEPTPAPHDSPDPSELDSSEVAASSSSRMPAATGDLYDEDELDPEQTASVPATPVHLRVLQLLSRRERVRFAVGVMLAVLVGFVVTSIVASSREASRYSTIIAELKAEYDAAETSVAWDALDDSRATALETLSVRRRNVVIMSVFLWLIVAGIFAFLWLRVLDWSRWEESVMADPLRTPTPS